MADLQEGALSRTRHLPRLSIDSSSHYTRSSLSSISSLSSSTRASLAPSFSTMSSESDNCFFVLCLFDFKTEDPDQLAFRSDEVLRVIRTEDSGWWAAIREGDYRVGWIPSSYVEPLSYDLDSDFDSLSLHGQQTSKGCEFGAEVVLPESASMYDRQSIIPPERQMAQRPRNLDDKPLPPPPDCAELSFENKARFSNSINSDLHSPGQEITFYPQTAIKPYPPSPAVPLPPTPKTAPLHANVVERKRSFTVPVPGLIRSDSYPLSADTTASFHARHVRRRPLLIRDEVALNRLSVLIETSSVQSMDDITDSPIGNDMEQAAFGGKSPTPKPGKIKQITGDDMAQALHAAQAALASRPWFLRPTYGDDQVKIEFDGSVVAGTLPALVERLTSDALSLSVERAFRHAFLSTFRTMSDANEIFDLLLERYYLDTPADLTLAELDEWRIRCLLPTQRRVLSVFTTWLVEHNMIEDEPPIARRLQDFLTEITASAENVGIAQQVMKTLERLTFAMPAIPYASAKLPKRRKSKDSKHDLLRLDPTAVAEQLCLYEHALYAKIRPQECLDWVKVRAGDTVANLLTFCSLHDKLAAWVKQSVLWTENLGHRADLLDFWIKVAEKSRGMRNFSSMSAIVTALSSTVLQRLHLTWAHVGRTSHLPPLNQLNDPAGSFSACRQAQQSADTPCVPFIGMYLTDIVHINDGYHDTSIDTGKSTERIFSFLKRRKWSDVLDISLAHQKRRYSFSQDLMITQYIESSLTLASEVKPAAFWTQSQDVQQTERARADIRKGLEAAGF